MRASSLALLLHYQMGSSRNNFRNLTRAKAKSSQLRRKNRSSRSTGILQRPLRQSNHLTSTCKCSVSKRTSVCQGIALHTSSARRALYQKRTSTLSGGCGASTTSGGRKGSPSTRNMFTRKKTKASLRRVPLDRRLRSCGMQGRPKRMPIVRQTMFDWFIMLRYAIDWREYDRHMIAQGKHKCVG